MKEEIPALFKKTSTYINRIEKYDDFVISQTIQKLVATKSFWEMAVNRAELIPLSISENPKVSAKQLQKQNNECLEMVRKKLGSEKFEEYANPESEICKTSAEKQKQKDEETYKFFFFDDLIWQKPDNWFKNFFKLELGNYSEAELAFIIRFINANGFGDCENDDRAKKVPQKKSRELQDTALNNIRFFLGIQKFDHLQNAADEICIELINEFDERVQQGVKYQKENKKWNAKLKAESQKFKQYLDWEHGGGKENFWNLLLGFFFFAAILLFAMWLWSYDSNPEPSCEKFYSKTLNREMCI